MLRTNQKFISTALRDTSYPIPFEVTNVPIPDSETIESIDDVERFINQGKLVLVVETDGGPNYTWSWNVARIRSISHIEINARNFSIHGQYYARINAKRGSRPVMVYNPTGQIEFVQKMLPNVKHTMPLRIYPNYDIQKLTGDMEQSGMFTWETPEKPSDEMIAFSTPDSIQPHHTLESVNTYIQSISNRIYNAPKGLLEDDPSQIAWYDVDDTVKAFFLHPDQPTEITYTTPSNPSTEMSNELGTAVGILMMISAYFLNEGPIISRVIFGVSGLLAVLFGLASLFDIWLLIKHKGKRSKTIVPQTDLTKAKSTVN